MMNNERTPRSKRSGGIKSVIALLLLLAALIVAVVLNGSLNQEKQQSIMSTAYDHFNQGDYQKAFELFSEAETTFSFTLSAYQMVRPGDYLSRNDLGEMLISICLSAAYDSFFNLEPAPDWISKAKDKLTTITDEQRKKELEQVVATAADVSLLCQAFAEENYEKAFKDLKKVEQASLAGDQDFFIFEIRFLIALGKVLEEPLILNKARELLFFATTDAGINNEKTKQLWGILTN